MDTAAYWGMVVGRMAHRAARGDLRHNYLTAYIGSNDDHAQYLLATTPSVEYKYR